MNNLHLFYRKLTTYTLRRTVRDYNSSIKAVESQIESLEKKLQELHQKAKKNQNALLMDANGSPKTETNDSEQSFDDDRLERQSLFAQFFSSVQGRAPLSSTYV